MRVVRRLGKARSRAGEVKRMTRYAILSDVHSNLEALEATRADLEKHSPDRIVCCGDLVGYGADPLACIQCFRELLGRYGGAARILGNHDYAAVWRDVRGFSADAAVAALWTHDQLSSWERGWLGEAGLTWQENDMLFAHGSPGSPEEWRYLWSPHQVEREIYRFDEQICFVGHTHQPFIYLAGKGRFADKPRINVPAGTRCVVNVGSVGQPRDGDPRAAYCTYDDVDRLLTIHRVDYDIETAARKILSVGLPETLAQRLFYGF